MTNETFVKSLRELADWYEKHPDVPLPMLGQSLTVWLTEMERPFEVLSKLGSFDKRYTDHYFDAEKMFGDIRLTFTFQREQVCVRKVVGTKHIEAELVPAKLVPARDEEIVEWECLPVTKKEE